MSWGLNISWQPNTDVQCNGSSQHGDQTTYDIQLVAKPEALARFSCNLAHRCDMCDESPNETVASSLSNPSLFSAGGEDCLQISLRSTAFFNLGKKVLRYNSSELHKSIKLAQPMFHTVKVSFLVEDYSYIYANAALIWF